MIAELGVTFWMWLNNEKEIIQEGAVKRGNTVRDANVRRCLRRQIEADMAEIGSKSVLW